MRGQNPEVSRAHMDCALRTARRSKDKRSLAGQCSYRAREACIAAKNSYYDGYENAWRERMSAQEPADARSAQRNCITLRTYCWVSG